MPIPADIEIKVPEKKVWPVLPDDVYQVQITELTAEHDDYQGKSRDIFKFEFTVIEDGEYYGRKLWKRASRIAPVASDNNKHPTTYLIVSAIRKLTKEESKAFGADEFNKLIGKQLRLTITTTEPNTEGKQYNNIGGYLPIKAMLPPFDESRVVKNDEPVIQKEDTEPFIKPEDYPSIQHVDDEIDASDIPL